jgi:hypothetical protein
VNQLCDSCSCVTASGSDKSVRSPNEIKVGVPSSFVHNPLPSVERASFEEQMGAAGLDLRLAFVAESWALQDLNRVETVCSLRSQLRFSGFKPLRI